MHPFDEAIVTETRRQFFGSAARGLGVAALATLLDKGQLLGDILKAPAGSSLPGLPHFAPKAKRAIYLHMVGAPPQMDLFDYKPGLKDWFDKDLPDSVRRGQRLTTMTSGQTRFPIAPSVFKFQQHGQSGAWVSELLPHTAKMVDDLAIIRSVHTEAINHEPAITFIQTGQHDCRQAVHGCVDRVRPGQHESGSTDICGSQCQPLASQSQRSGDLCPSVERRISIGAVCRSGVALRRGSGPLHQQSRGSSRQIRRRMLDALGELNRIEHEKIRDPETLVRIAQFEMAFRMQSSVPELTDLSKEPESTYKLYGDDARKGGTFAHSCLMARRLVERDVRFVQVYHRGWDVHGSLPEVLPSQCRDVDQACWALVQDLKSRGLLDSTLVDLGRRIWSNGLFARKAHRNRPWPRSSSALL